MSQRNIVVTLVILMLIVVAPSILFVKGTVAIVVSALLIFVIFSVFVLFSLDMIRDIGDRASIPAAILLGWSILCMICLFVNVFRWTGFKDSLIDNYQGHSKLLNCIYLSTVTWTTLGYGDITPTPESRIVAALEAMTGYVVMALLIAVLVVMAQASQQPKN